jgi:beta-N-acetylhexosaminidase
MRVINAKAAFAARRAQRWSITLIVGAGMAVVVLAVAALVFLSHTPHTPVSALPSGPTGAIVPSPRPTSPVSPSPTAPDRDGCVEATLSKLSLADQVGQLVLLGTPVGNPASVSAAVHTYHVGGVFLAGRSSKSAASLRKAIGSLQSAATAAGGIRLDIAIDQEGGTVQTLKGADFPTIPSAVKQGQWATATLRAQTIAWARRLAGIGITLDLAPVADTVPAGTAKLNPPVGALDREFGSDPTRVASDIGTVVSAAQSTGMLTTLKHFPGLGRVRTNTDTGTGAVDNVATTADPYLAPFTSGIGAGAGAVMISLASYPKLDSHSIAAFSAPIVTGLLRDRLGFTGLIVSDDLGSAVAVKSVPIGQRAVRFIQAGGDQALTVRSSDAKPIVTALVAAAKKSASFAAKVKAAASDVLHSKFGAGLLTCAPRP